ncbi:hypothetical protein ROHU_006365 [Labeo rohita]|uniref:Uncharacterized protein n=1 Tax=Labeo rohita TaxID=84645 RepID=A0A498MQR8_LABRO|nr:hypothetical protein ROHU_006365 [Labeo rohita]
METSCVGTGRWGKISFNSSAADEQTRALNIPHKDLEPEGNMIKPRAISLAEQTDQRRPPPRPPETAGKSRSNGHLSAYVYLL